MPLIPIPTDNEPEPVYVPETNKSMAWYEWYLNVPNWKCPHCKTVVFGRCKSCPYCKSRLKIITPRPVNYVVSEVFNG